MKNAMERLSDMSNHLQIGIDDIVTVDKFKSGLFQPNYKTCEKKMDFDMTAKQFFLLR